MKTILTLFTLLFIQYSFGQKEVALTSEINSVTVFFQGAQISRMQKANLKPGKQMIVFKKLTDFIDPNSVQAKAKGDLTILSVQTRKNFEDLKLSTAETDKLSAKRTELERKERTLKDEYLILATDKDLIMKNRNLKGNDSGLSVEELKAAYTFMHSKISEITTRQTSIEYELEEIILQMNRIDQKIQATRSKPVTNYSEIMIEVDVNSSTSAEFFVNYISPNASWTPYYDMRSSGINAPVTLEAKALVSQTTGIEWEDINLTLSTNDPYENSQEQLLQPWYLTYYNRPKQREVYRRGTNHHNYSGQTLRGEVIDAQTGEPLPFAKVTFPGYPNIGAVSDVDGKFNIIVPKGATTVNAEFVGYAASSLEITAPYLKFFLDQVKQELEEVYISSKDKSGKCDAYGGIDSPQPRLFNKREKRKFKGERMRSDIQLSGVSSAANYSSFANTTTTQKDLRVEYAIETTFSIPSNGVEQRVAISSHSMKADYEYHSAPKLDPSVYLVANVSGWEQLNLLNGESNLYFDGTYIGKTYVDANSLKDTLTFSLGKDSKVQIQRNRIHEKSSNRVIGSRKKFEVTWEITAKNNSGAAIPLIIKDQFPLSTDNDIKVKIGDYSNGKLDEKSNIITWKTTLNQGGKQSFIFDYKVDYNKSKPLYIE